MHLCAPSLGLCCLCLRTPSLPRCPSGWRTPHVPLETWLKGLLSESSFILQLPWAGPGPSACRHLQETPQWYLAVLHRSRGRAGDGRARGPPREEAAAPSSPPTPCESGSPVQPDPPLSHAKQKPWRLKAILILKTQPKFKHF